MYDKHSDQDRIRHAREYSPERRYALVFVQYPLLYRQEKREIHDLKENDIFTLVYEENDFLLNKKIVEAVSNVYKSRYFGHIIDCKLIEDFSHLDMQKLNSGHDILLYMWEQNDKHLFDQILLMENKEIRDFIEHLHKKEVDHKSTFIELLDSIKTDSSV